MTIEESILQIVEGAASVTGLVGTRIYPNRIVQGSTYPMMAFVCMEQEPIKGQGGICAREFEFMFHVVSNKVEDGADMREVLIDLLDGYSGTVGDNQISVIRYTGVSLNAQENDSDLYHMTIDFNVLINK